MAIKYGLGNLVTEDTLETPSSESILYTKERLYNQLQSSPFKGTSLTTLYISVDLGADTLVNMVGVMNHNLVAPSTFKLKANTQATGAFTNCAEAGDASWDLSKIADHPNSYKIFNSAGTLYRYLCLNITDVGNLDYMQIGEYILTTHGTFSRNFNWGYSRGEIVIKTDLMTTWGQRHRNKRSKKKFYNVEFNNMTEADLLAEVEAFFRTLDGDQPFLFVPEDTEDYSYYMYVLNDERAKRDFLDHNSFNLDLEEEVKGITLL